MEPASLQKSATGQLIVLTGPSGVGKGTLKKRLLALMPHITESVSMTTRGQRPGELDGKDYCFVTREQFEQHVANNHLLEWAEFAGNLYGTPKTAVQQLLQQGQHVLLEIEVQGALAVKAQFPEALMIFIEPPSLAELERRIRARNTNDEADIQARLAIAEKELAQKNQFTAIVCNEQLEHTVQQLLNLLQVWTQKAPVEL